MTEAETIDSARLPLTTETLIAQFQACGLPAGQTVLVHSAMSKLGWIAGGAVAVIQALRAVLTPSGTLMMPTHTTDNTDPGRWQNPPVPQHWWDVIRAQMPAYDPAVTPTRQMGRIAELFRTLPGVRRSAHPIGSFAALGPYAEYLTFDHRLHSIFGEDSPIARLYALDGYVMLLGVGHSNNTSLHLAEYRARFPSKNLIREGASMLVDGHPQWVWHDMLQLDTDDFDLIGAAYEAESGITIHRIGAAEVRFMRQRPLVDFAVKWMEQNRS